MASVAQSGQPVCDFCPDGLTHTLIGFVFALIYVTLYRRVYQRLPAWLRTGKVELTWRDLRIPGLLAAVSVILGLMVIT